jgi:hypothetical protein
LTEEDSRCLRFPKSFAVEKSSECGKRTATV